MLTTNKTMDLYARLSKHVETQHGPLARRVARALTAAIDNGLLAAGSALPPERELAAGLGLSRSTLRQALRELAAAGRVVIKPGAGTIVAGSIAKALSRLSSFSEDMRRRGLRPSSKVLERTIGPVPPDTAFRTGMSLNTQILSLVRLRLADDEPMSYERAIVPLSAVGADFCGEGSLYARMQAHQARPVRVLQSLTAIAAPDDIAGFLGIAPGAAVLEIGQIGHDASGRAVEDAISWYRGDRYKYVGEISG